MNNDNSVELDLRDLHPSRTDFRADVLYGLQQPQKWISSMYFYDRHGSQLFDQICELPEYYPTRTELAILGDNITEICERLGPRVMLIEPGSGSSVKVRLLLDHLQSPVAYVPVEISRAHLMQAASEINTDYPSIEVLPVCADFTQLYEIPVPQKAPERRVVYFPGSTIGNFEPDDALALLHTMRAVAGDGGALLIGVDLRKDPAILESAYNDGAGITSAFNLNLLVRLNRELNADFDLKNFRHEAVWNEANSRMEMRLKSLCEQRVHIGGELIYFREGEYIHTESSYKYTVESFAELVSQAGFGVTDVWMDKERLFSVQLCRVTGRKYQA